ncbi:MAG TPA: hypothetical protein PKW80_16035 [Bacteroidales bacterium]|nr:hypothetical protein [Bacteroidales bacterium]
MKEIIRQQADSMGYYFVQNDFNNYMKYQHPRLVKKLGGEQSLINILNENVTKNGYQAMSIFNDAPSKIIVTDTNLQCTLPQKMIMKIGNTKLEILSTLICISYDNGKKWFFINASVPSSVLKEILPEISNELVIQEQQTHKINY